MSAVLLELELTRLKGENAELKKVLTDTLWMAAQYANNKVFSPLIVNKAIDTCTRLNVQLNSLPHVTDPILGEWNPNPTGRTSKGKVWQK